MDLREAIDVFWAGCVPAAPPHARLGEAYDVVRAYLRARVARHAVACALHATEEDLDDLTARVVVKLVRRARAVPVPEYPRAYLTTAAKRIVQDTRRPDASVVGGDVDDPEGDLEGAIHRAAPVVAGDVARESLLEECRRALDGWTDARAVERNATSAGSGERMRAALASLEVRKLYEAEDDPTESDLRSMRRHRCWLLARAWESTASSHARSTFYRATFGDLPVFAMNGIGDDRVEPRLKRLGRCAAHQERHGEGDADLLVAVETWEEPHTRAGVADASLACATFDVFRLALVGRYVIHDGKTARAAAARVSGSVRLDRPAGEPGSPGQRTA